MKVALADIAAVTDGTHYTPKAVQDGVPFLTVKDMSASGLDLIGSSRISVPDFLNARAGNAVPVRGDVLFSKDGTVGKVQVVDTDREFAVLSSIAIIRPDTSRVDPKYLACVLGSPALLEMAERRKTGSAVRRIILADLKRLEFPLPPLPEQRRIASILDRVDALVAIEKRAARAQIDLAQAAFESTRRSPTQEFKVSDLYEVTGGKRLPKGAPYAESVTRHPYLRVSDMEAGSFRTQGLKYLTAETQRSIERYTVSSDDLVISIAGTIGQVSTVPPPLSGANLTENAARLRPRNPGAAVGAYVSFAMASDQVQAQISAATGQVTIGKLALFRISALRLELPSIEVQEAFASTLSQLGHLKDLHSRRAHAASELFASLQYRAFRGEL